MCPPLVVSSFSREEKRGTTARSVPLGPVGVPRAPGLRSPGERPPHGLATPAVPASRGIHSLSAPGDHSWPPTALRTVTEQLAGPG